METGNEAPKASLVIKYKKAKKLLFKAGMCSAIVILPIWGTIIYEVDKASHEEADALIENPIKMTKETMQKLRDGDASGIKEVLAQLSDIEGDLMKDILDSAKSTCAQKGKGWMDKVNIGVKGMPGTSYPVPCIVATRYHAK